jgi:putative restriction endonuclease
MRMLVALTDREWARHLSLHRELEEVNFWRPRSKDEFHALQPGEPLLFKLHAPERAICGVGWFEGFTKLPVFLAWRTFGGGNGAPTYEAFLDRLRIGRHGQPISDLEELGCIMLRQPSWFPEKDWIPEPSDWARNIVQEKAYPAESGVGREIWEQVLERLSASALPAGEYADAGPVTFVERVTQQRLGQGAFRALITNAYGRRCAFTRERVLPTLEACHIRPAARGGSHALSNGLLLRADVHALFDAGYLGVHPMTMRIQASPRLQDDFQNGMEYRALDGQELWAPSFAGERPAQLQLEWHMDQVFRR